MFPHLHFPSLHPTAIFSPRYSGSIVSTSPVIGHQSGRPFVVLCPFMHLLAKKTRTIIRLSHFIISSAFVSHALATVLWHINIYAYHFSHLPILFYSLFQSRAAERNIISSISDAGLVLSCLFAFFTALNSPSPPVGQYTPTR